MKLQAFLDSIDVKTNIEDSARHDRGVSCGEGALKQVPGINRVIDGVLLPKWVHGRERQIGGGWSGRRHGKNAR